MMSKTQRNNELGYVPDPSEALRGVRSLLQFIGEDVEREGLKETPERVLRAFVEMTSGMNEDVSKYLSKTFDVKSDEMVLVKGIRFASMCEHHLLPFTGTATVAYIPNGRVVGLSKLPRTVLAYAKRPQVQERMTEQIADALDSHLNPKGVGVIIRANHSCMGCRGIKQPDAEMITSAMRGLMFTDPKARSEFLQLARE
tara:strand:+ start:1567 stop:2163 length:597 start_codon:yes stop_codon:yes gene_type:complete